MRDVGFKDLGFEMRGLGFSLPGCMLQASAFRVLGCRVAGQGVRAFSVTTKTSQPQGIQNMKTIYHNSRQDNEEETSVHPKIPKKDVISNDHHDAEHVSQQQ